MENNFLEFRIEKDSMGELKVPSTCYYGAQTARSINFFSIGSEIFPLSFIYSLVLIKKAAAIANSSFKILDYKIKDLIINACDKILNGNFDTEFPLKIWQTGSGTQTNMNINEVIANIANELSGSKKGTKYPVHPNDHVNMCQSTNDVFPSGMQICSAIETNKLLLPNLRYLIKILNEKSSQFKDIVKIGRTHLMDATPLTVSQEFNTYVDQLSACISSIENLFPKLFALPLGGTAVGTGLNAHPEFGDKTSSLIKEFTGLPFYASLNKFEGISSHDVLVNLSGTLKTLAIVLNKIANDIRFLASGPRGGIFEYILPENEPGSSIMPGKVNPTQCEALSMITAQVFGNDLTISFAGANGHFQLNAYKPVIIYNLFQSITLLGEGAKNFAEHCLKGMKLNLANISKNLNNSLMLVTALSPHIGYDNAAKIAKEAFQYDISIKEAALKLKVLDEKSIDNLIDPYKMTKPGI